MTELLDTLADADWSDIDAAVYGLPDDVLEHLKLIVDNPKEGNLDTLFGEIYHQGDVYETTARTIPYLVDLLRPELTQYRELREEILVGLGYLYSGVSREPEITEQVEDAIRAGLPVYREHLACSDPAVRYAALFLLGSLKDDASVLLPLLRSLYKVATEPVERAALLFCYGRLSDYEERQAVLLPVFRDVSEPEVVRLLTALVLGETEEAPMPAEISGMPCEGQESSPDEVRSYLEAILPLYGNPSRSTLLEQAEAILFQDVDGVVEMVLDEI